MKIEIRTFVFSVAAIIFLFVSVSAGAVTVFVQYDGGTIVDDPALVSATGSDFDVSANLQSGEFKGRAEGQGVTDQNAYAGILTRLQFTNNTGGQIIIEAGDFVAHVQGDYTFGTGPSQSAQVNTSFQVRIGATTYIAGSRHNLATGSVVNDTNTFTKLFETNGASVALTTASSSQLDIDLLMPELTLDPGATMEVNWDNSPVVNTDQPQVLPGNFAEADFFTGANGMTLSLVLPAGVTLDSDSTVPLDWVTTVPVHIDVTGVTDVSGDAVPDVAYLTVKAQPKVRYYSGATSQQISNQDYLGTSWTGVAAATVVDSNADGVADDPAVAVLAHKASNSKHAVEVRSATSGALINKIFFLGPDWQVLDVAVIDDKNGDGVTGDTLVAVLGYNPNKPFDQQIKVEVRRLSDGARIAGLFFLNGNWMPVALEGVNRMGQTPLLAVLANKPSTGNNSVQARKLNDGSLQRDTAFWDNTWAVRDIAILRDSNGDGNADDPGYVVLANDAGGRNKVQGKRVSDGVNLKNVSMFSTSWVSGSLTTTGDISGNLIEEVGALGEKNDGKIAIQLRDYDDKTVTGTISP